MNFEAMIQKYNEGNAFCKENGMILEVSKPGHIFYKIKILEKHLSSPETCHGGVLAALMDATLGTAALTYAFTQDMLCSTVEFKLNYYAPVQFGDELIGEGKIDFTGKRLVCTSAEIRSQKDSKKIFSKGLGTFNLYPITKRNIFKK